MIKRIFRKNMPFYLFYILHFCTKKLKGFIHSNFCSTSDGFGEWIVFFLVWRGLKFVQHPQSTTIVVHYPLFIPFSILTDSTCTTFLLCVLHPFLSLFCLIPLLFYVLFIPYFTIRCFVISTQTHSKIILLKKFDNFHTFS